MVSHLLISHTVYWLNSTTIKGQQLLKILLPFSYQVKLINVGGVVGILVFFPTAILASGPGFGGNELPRKRQITLPERFRDENDI
jgi:hypothetical protein